MPLVAVLDGCRRGDSAAFADLYRRFARVVHGIVLATAGREDAEDLTQDVFMKIHGNLDAVRDGAAIPGWICAVARNTALDHARGARRRPTPLPLVAEALPPAPEVPADVRELGEQLLGLIRELPETYRETLVLRLVEGLTGPEIAARTGMTHGSVRVNLSRGMARLRPLVAGLGWS